MQLTRQSIIPAMSPAAVERVRQLEARVSEGPQVILDLDHLFHAGMYARTLKVPAGVMITGALIKIPTVVIVSGDCLVYTGEDSRRLTGYNVFAADQGRKQVFVAIEDTYITMMFATQSTTVAEAEAEFTDETDLLKHGD